MESLIKTLKLDIKLLFSFYIFSSVNLCQFFFCNIEVCFNKLSHLSILRKMSHFLEFIGYQFLRYEST